MAANSASVSRRSTPFPALSFGWFRRLAAQGEAQRAAVTTTLTAERELRRVLNEIAGDLVLEKGDKHLRLTYDDREVYVRTLAVRDRPARVWPGMMTELLHDLGGSVTVALHLDPMDKNAAMRMLNGQRTVGKSTLDDDASHNQITDIATTSGIYSAEQMAAEVFHDRQVLFGVEWVITLTATSIEELDATERRLRNKWKHRVPLGSTLFQQRAGRLSTTPYAQTMLPHTWTTSSETVAQLWPFLHKKLGTSYGARVGYSLVDGEPVFLYPWAVEEGWNAGHGIVPAPNGSGKTVAVGTLITELYTLEVAPQIIIIDPIKGDFRRLVRELDGQIVYMSTRPDISLNPLDLPNARYFSGTGDEAEQNPVLEQTRLVTGLFMDMTKLHDDDTEDLLEKAVLMAYHARGINEDDETTWHKGPHEVPLLADVVAQINQLEEEERDDPDALEAQRINAPLAQKLKTRLRRYLKGTLKGLLSNPTSLNLDARVTCFDLERTDPRFKAIATWLITNWVWQQAKRDRKPRFLYLEEVKTLLEKPETALMVAHLYALGRAYQLAVWSATQLLEDYEATEEGRRALQNAVTVLLLKQSKGAEAAKQRYTLSDEDQRRLETCAQGEGILITPAEGGTYGWLKIDPPPLVLEWMGGPPAEEPR